MNKYNNPKISVIIPVYNGEKYLAQCLDSLINQTFKDFEIICVNDGSTDKSLDILEQYSQKDSRISVISQKNAGVSPARNRALPEAKGKYLSVLDCDDFFEYDMFSKMYNNALKYDTDITVCGVKLFDDQTKTKEDIDVINFNILPDKKVFSSKENSKYIFQIGLNWCWNKLYKAEFIRNNNILFHDVKMHDDIFFVAYALSKAERISVLDKKLYVYRINNPLSVSSKKLENRFAFYETMNLLKEYLIKDNNFELFKQSFANYAMDLIRGYYNALDLQFKADFLENLGIKKLNSQVPKRKYFTAKKYYLFYFILSNKALISLTDLLFPFVHKIYRFLKI